MYTSTMITTGIGGIGGGDGAGHGLFILVGRGAASGTGQTIGRGVSPLPRLLAAGPHSFFINPGYTAVFVGLPAPVVAAGHVAASRSCFKVVRTSVSHTGKYIWRRDDVLRRFRPRRQLVLPIHPRQSARTGTARVFAPPSKPLPVPVTLAVTAVPPVAVRVTLVAQLHRQRTW
jgi:hypothetical protein